MADDPHRDYLPVRDNSHVETYRSSIVTAIVIDPRERLTVSKLDRDDLEDKYLRLQEDYQELKKFSNTQEDKIKRLATKLMRISATPIRSCCPLSNEPYDDKNTNEFLALENTKLKDKIIVLRNQILSHKGLRRSSSQTRRLQMYNSSRPTTYRSENGRTKIPSYPNLTPNHEDDIINRNYVIQIEELELQRKEMMSRIKELENKLSSYETGNHKEKIAENVEYIRIWRQMKLQQEELIQSQALNESLNAEIEELKKILDESSKNNGQMTATLLAEKQRVNELDEQVTRSHDVQQSLREKDEQIRDLMSEMKILQQHNSELMNLSTKCSEVEIENTELRKKVQDLVTDNHGLKTEFNSEQANIKALQAANSQLVEKLQELQKNMDSLTIQLKSFQNQHKRLEKENSEKQSPKSIEKEFKKQKSSPIQSSVNKSPETTQSSDARDKYRTITEQIVSPKHEKIVPNRRNYETVAVQTDINEEPHWKKEIQLKNNSSKSPLKVNSKTQTMYTDESGTGNLSRVEMLKLLDDAEINTTLDTQSAEKLRQINGLSPKNSNYMNAGHRQSTTSLQSIPSHLTVCCCDSKIRSCREIYVMYNALKNYCPNIPNDFQDKSLIIIHTKKSQSTKSMHNPVDQNNHTPPVNIILPTKLSTCDRFKVKSSNEKYEDNENQYAMCMRSEKCTCSAETEAFAMDSSKRQTLRATKAPRSAAEQKPTAAGYPLENESCPHYPALINKYTTQHYEVTSPPKNRVNFKKICCMCGSTHNNSEVAVKNSEIESHDRGFKRNFNTEQDGHIEIHILSLQPSTYEMNNFFQINNKIIERKLFVRTEFCDQRRISTSIIKYPELNFNSSCIYRSAKLDEFLECIQHDDVYFQLDSVLDTTQPYAIAHGKINVKDILDYPQNKLHYFVNMNRVLSQYETQHFGRLSIWVRLSCDINTVNLFRTKKGRMTVETKSGCSRDCKGRNGNLNDEKPEVKHETPIEDAKMKKDVGIDSPEKSTINWKPQYADTKRVIKENKDDENIINELILPDVNSSETIVIKQKEKDITPTEMEIDDITVDQYSDTLPLQTSLYDTKVHEMSTAIFDDKVDEEIKTESIEIDRQNNAIVIKIDYLKLNEGCSLLNNTDFHRLYVEFMFLGKIGLDLETMSVPIPKSHTEKMYFNYSRKFSIDENTDAKECELLQSMLFGDENPVIPFTIVSEPLEEEMETADCIEVGHAFLDLKNHVFNNRNSDIFLTVNDTTGSGSIGVLKISLLGINAIRQCAPLSSTFAET